jgi:multidrug efflux pump subunit AcrB
MAAPQAGARRDRHLNVSAPFIKRPVATTLLAVAVVLAGGAGYSQLPVAPLPRVDSPTINASAGLPGASPETMASAVATPLERRFGRIAGVNEITSASTLGQTSLTLQFGLDRDVDSAARDVQAAINAAGGDLPAGLPNRPRYQKVNPADAPILIVALTSKTMPLGPLFDTANTILAQKISQVSGVGQVTVGGGQQPAVRVSVDPVALAGVGLSLEDVRSALSRATANSPKGALSGTMQASSINANDQLTNAAGYRPLIIGYQNGAPVRLKDVARVIDDVENQRAAGWVDGERAIPVIIRRQPGANIIDVIDRVKALLPELAHSINPSIDVHVALDRSTTIRASVADVQMTLLISVALVVLVVFLFLRSGWATTIPSVAVPLSLIGTFGAMYLCGYSLDNLSLMALTISTGFVVDDAIVVTENVSRFIEMGDTPMQAAFKGAKQIGFTIVSITVSLLAVFIPILLMGGLVGRLFREFAVTLSIAIAMSAVVSLTLTPMMASRMLRSEREVKHGRFSRASERAFEWMRGGYGHALQWVLGHELFMIFVTLATIAFTFYLYIVVPKGLFPQQDTGSLAGSSDAPQDISFPAMKERTEALNRVLAEDPNIDHFVSFIGQGNSGFFFVQLKPLGARKLSADQVITELRPKLARVPGISLFLQNVQDVRLGGRLSRAQYQWTLVDANLEELNQWAPRMLDKLRSLPELRDVNSDQQTNALRLDVTVDRDTAARLGITAQAVDETL